METRKHFLSLDIGTTCCKAQLFDERGDILFYRSEECPLRRIDGESYADLERIAQTVKALVREAAKAAPVSSLAFSSFGESFVLLDRQDRLLTLPMLYTDPRGSRQAQELEARFGRQKLCRITGVTPHAMYSVSKLLWLRENRPKIYESADKLLLICDYFGYLFTGKRCIDYGLAARTGLFDVRRKEFSSELLNGLGISPSLFSQPMPAGSVVGRVQGELAGELGLPADCVLVLGSHDQICTTLGAGAVKAGDAADGMGTVECLTSILDVPPDDPAFAEMGYPLVPYAIEGLYCTYILNSTCGSVVSWLRKSILHDYSGSESDFFAYMEKRLGAEPADALLLPYFAGASTPYQDVGARGAFLNLSLQTTDAELYRAVLEGMAYEIKLNLRTVGAYGITVREATATGGGANSDAWLQIKADVCGIPLRTLRSSEGGLCGCAILQAAALGTAGSPEGAASIFVRQKRVFLPSKAPHPDYERNYRRYEKLYTLLKEIN